LIIEFDPRAFTLRRRIKLQEVNPYCSIQEFDRSNDIHRVRTITL